MKMQECVPLGSKSRRIIQKDEKIGAQCLTREYPLVLQHLKDVWAWDVEGRKYLDFTAGVAVANAGHCNPRVIAAIQKQVRNGIHPAFADFFSELPLQFIEELLNHAKGFERVFLSNSGAEAIESTFKLARWHTRKKWFIAFEHAFHGRTMAALSLTKSKPVQRDRFEPFLQVEHAPYPDAYHWKNDDTRACTEHSLNAVEQLFQKHKNDVAGVFVEPILGEGGYIVPTADFLPRLRKLCNEYDALLCTDEVQSGAYRTGTFLAAENWKVQGDIVAMAKAIGGELPLGATLSSAKIMSWPKGAHGSTFGGNLASCAAGIAALRFMREKRLGENAKKVGSTILKRLKEAENEMALVGNVRGKGLMIGIELVKSKRSKTPAVAERDEVLCEALKRGLLLLPAGHSVIRICPPLTITKETAESGTEKLLDAIRAVGK